MKNQAIIALILIVAMALSVTIALAENWSPSALVNGATGWDTPVGSFGGSFTGGGVYAAGTDYATGAHPLPDTSDGNFDLTIPFKIFGNQTRIYVGFSTASDAQDTSGWTVVGNDGDALAYSHGGFSNLDYLSDSPFSMGTQYTAHFTSTDGGHNALVRVDGYPGSTNLAISGKPKFVVIYLKNNGTLGQQDAVPEVMTPTYTYTKASPTENPSISPNPNSTVTVTPAPAQTGSTLNLQAIKDFYANQPIVHMSNQSVVYNPDGTIARTIGSETPVGANVTKPTVTVAPNATAVPTVKANATAVVTVTAKPSVPAATKTQSPGFEMVLAAVGMLSALALITRKKK